jgi:hypothetical protein
MPKIRKIVFGQVREIPADVNETRIIPFTLSTPTRDRHHTVLNQENWQLDNFRKNPVVGYMHNLYGDLCNPPDPDNVIAMDKGIRVEDVAGVLSLLGLPYFEPAELNLVADKVFRKLILGTLRAASVGFNEVGQGEWGQGEEAQGRDNETYYFAGQELWEYSIVSIPSNPDAVKKSMRNQTGTALAYVCRALGEKYRMSQIEQMRVCDVLDLLDGKDIEIRETDPEKVRKMLQDEQAKKYIASKIEEQQLGLKKRIAAKANN